MGCALLALSQNGTNPLDIKGRDADPSIVQDSVYQEAIQSISNDNASPAENARAKNPFDVSHIPLKKSEVRPKRRTPDQSSSGMTDFLFWVVLGLLVFFAGIMFFFRENIFGLIRPILNSNLHSTLNRESRGGRNPMFISLYLFFLLNAGVFIYHLLAYLNISFTGIQSWFYIIGGIAAVYSIKHIGIYFLKWVFPLQKPLSNYGFAVVMFNGIVGIFLLPVNILLTYGAQNWHKTFLIAGVVTIVIIYLLRLFKGFILSSRVSSNNIFHFFLYLCGSEIAPIALIYGMINHGF